MNAPDAPATNKSDARAGEPVDARVGALPDAPAPVVDLKRSALERALPSADAKTVADLVDGNTEFAFALYGRVRQPSSNLIFSPYSITSAMAMAWAGAKGKTAQEIATVFHFGDPTTTQAAMNALDQQLRSQDSQLVLQTANALWVLPTLTPLMPYLDVLATDYGAGVGLVDFNDPQKAADTIDAWVSSNTAGTIPRLLEPADLPDTTTAVLTNTLYFKAQWATQFEKSLTSDAPFELSPGNMVSVKMMRDVVSGRYHATADYQAAAVPYRARAGHKYEMVVILPAKDLATFETAFDAAALAALLSSLKQQDVDLSMPRFQLRTGLHLKDALGALGMPTAFGGDADFSGVSAPSPGNINDVVHQGYISVDENGTEASAATAVVFEDGAASFPDVAPPILRLDRPFLAIIRDAGSGTVLFMARIAQP
jgi:serpin B